MQSLQFTLGHCNSLNNSAMVSDGFQWSQMVQVPTSERNLQCKYLLAPRQNQHGHTLIMLNLKFSTFAFLTHWKGLN